jgi:uncharacterized membrane protein
MKAIEHVQFRGVHPHLSRPFGAGRFGSVAEGTARFFGTPFYLVGQTAVVLAWVAANALHWFTFDLYPFILLNLAFSLQAAYAAPLILLAETRQAARDKASSESDAMHREQLADTTLTLLEQNTALTRQVHALSLEVRRLTAEMHHVLLSAGESR